MLRVKLLLLLCLVAAATGCGNETANSVLDDQPKETQEPVATAPAGPLVVYTSFTGRKIKPVLDAYRAETGTRYELLVDEATDSLYTVDTARSLPEADIYIANSFAELAVFAEADIFRPIQSATIDSQLPKELLDSEFRWVAISKRARVIVYNTDQLSSGDLERVNKYIDLGDESWSDQVCLSSSSNAGNQLLVAYLINALGERNAELAVRHWRANFAAPPFVTDRQLLEAVAAGQCALGIVDSNVALAFARSRQDAPVAPHVFADESEILFDVSGAGVSRHAHDASGAVAFLEWLTSPTPNALYASQDSELPANPKAPRGITPANWTADLKFHDSYSSLGFLQEDAVKLVERARYP